MTGVLLWLGVAKIQLICDFLFKEEAMEEMIDAYEFRLAMEQRKRELRKF